VVSWRWRWPAFIGSFELSRRRATAPSTWSEPGPRWASAFRTESAQAAQLLGRMQAFEVLGGRGPAGQGQQIVVEMKVVDPRSALMHSLPQRILPVPRPMPTRAGSDT
jgi:hypothetical protein